MKDKIMEEISTILHGNLITDEITEEQFICEEVIDTVILPAIEAAIKVEIVKILKNIRQELNEGTWQDMCERAFDMCENYIKELEVKG